MRYIDISPPVRGTTAVFPGDTPFTLDWTMRRDRGDSCTVSALRLTPHIGAHVDAPFHVRADGERLPREPRVGELELDAFIGRCRVVSSENAQVLDEQVVAGWDLGGARRVVVRTRAVADPDVFPRDGAYFTAGGAAALAATGICLVGLDTSSVDRWDSQDLAAHRTFFDAGVAILEGLDLHAVAPGDYDLIAVPLRLMDADASPVRALLRPLDPDSTLR